MQMQELTAGHGVLTAARTGQGRCTDLVLGILCVELLVHAWDFGQALHRGLAVAEPLAGQVLRLARATVTADLRARGSFADPVPAESGAPAIDQLIAFTGRRATG